MADRLVASVRRYAARLLGGRLQTVLILSFSLVAALTVVIGAWATSRVIGDYLSSAESDRVDRDMELAESFYQLKLDEVAAISHRLVLDRWVAGNATAATSGDEVAIGQIDEEIRNKISVLALGGTHLIALLDNQGNLVAGRVLSPDGSLSPLLRGGAWGDLPIIAAALSSGQEQKATEVIPADFLATVGLADQAQLPVLDTPHAAPEPFDPREGTAGLALVGVAPLTDSSGSQRGAVVSAYLFNNDFTLVDRIKQAAGIDTVTIFLGDLRVSTNVMTGQGKRAVGTRIAQEVYDVVLEQGRDYVGQAFVVNDTYITRYTPLRDHLGTIVGSLYVGARESTYRALVEAFNNRVAVIAVLTILVAAILAVPISRWIAGPITRLSDATERLAQGDMDVRVVVPGSGELARLAGSFNQMVETLQRTQAELLHKQKLASMGQLAAGVAHEINNPLGTIHLYAGALRKELPADDPRRDDLAVILRETDRCKTIVGDLLNFARQQEILAQPTDVHDLLEQAIGAVRPHPQFEQVVIERDYAMGMPPIEADPAQLLQVFVNLLNNAAEAIEGPGTIRLTTRVTSSSVVVNVADTGCGIPEENLGRLFTPFFTTKGPGRGTGLGLSIVYGIIKMHRGQITVQSKVGQGTTFTVTLPQRLPHEPGAPKADAGTIG
jgi:two-component system NtrC family sensor kinase